MAKDYRLIAEDSDIEHVVKNLCGRYGISPNIIEIEKYDGVTKLLDALGIEFKQPRRALGVVIDTDDSIVSRWEQLHNSALGGGYTQFPLEPKSEGTIIRSDSDVRPDLGIWLMPNNNLPGMVEDFVEQLIPKQDSLWPRAQQVVQEIPETERRFNRIIKAQIHTWLAWQEVPGRPLGQAITKRYFDANAPHAQQFVDWLRRLFELEAASQQ